MKFLNKDPRSAIVSENLTYQNGGHNKRLRTMLVREQCGFCAYTEKFIDILDSCEVEHFDPTKKNKDDDYFNYYAVLREANARKRNKQKKHAGAAFFRSLFFQNEEELAKRIRYVPGEFVYEEAEGDEEAAALIDFLGFNDPSVCNARRNHVSRLKGLSKDAGEQLLLNYLHKYAQELSYPTALEAELEVDLSEALSLAAQRGALGKTKSGCDSADVQHT